MQQDDDFRPAVGLPPAPQLDPADYLADMAGFDLSEAEKVEFLQLLWNILRSLMESGADIRACDPCGQLAAGVSAAAPARVESAFRQATAMPAEHKENGGSA